MEKKGLSAEEAAIQLVEAELKRNSKGAWTCAILAALFSLWEIWFFVTSDIRQDGNWIGFITIAVVILILVAGSTYGWRLISRDRRLLGQLRAVVSAMVSDERPGVWPPPPRATE